MLERRRLVGAGAFVGAAERFGTTSPAGAALINATSRFLPTFLVVTTDRRGRGPAATRPSRPSATRR
jgi:hypothetical protein